MAVKLPFGFRIMASDEPVDSRLILSKAQMLRTKTLVDFAPEHYLAVCKENNRIYIYDKSTEELDSETGRYKALENFLSFESEEAKAVIEEAIKHSQTILQIQEDIGSEGIPGTIKGDIKILQDDVANITSEVVQLTSEVNELQYEVEDESEGLIIKVNNLLVDTSELEMRIDEAREDIDEIEIWINNVKLDGGEVKATYALHPSLSHVIFNDDPNPHPTEIDYKGSCDIKFTAETGFTLPTFIFVNGAIVGATEVDCGRVKAKWIEDTLYLSDAADEVYYTITGVEV